MFRLCVAGSRGFDDFDRLCQVLDNLLSHIITNGRGPVTIVSGTARGADQLGERYAQLKGHTCERHPADWSRGRMAGMLRNELMANESDAVVCFWDGSSPGTRQMIDYCTKQGKPLRVIRY